MCSYAGNMDLWVLHVCSYVDCGLVGPAYVFLCGMWTCGSGMCSYVECGLMGPVCVSCVERGLVGPMSIPPWNVDYDYGFCICPRKHELVGRTCIPYHYINMQIMFTFRCALSWIMVRHLFY